jgi:histidyl-tRNA synthetase
MLPDAECLVVLQEALEELGLPDYVLKVNHRRLLDAMFQACGVAAADFTVVCSSVDKLDKLTPADVKKELCERKGQPAAVIDRVLALIAAGARNSSPDAVLALLESGAEFDAVRTGDACKAACATALAELRLLAQYMRAYGRADKRLTFDLSLARGLDYYTGVIFEVVLTGAAVGSVCGGGRYDDLVGMFAGRQVRLPTAGDRAAGDARAIIGAVSWLLTRC